MIIILLNQYQHLKKIQICLISLNDKEFLVKILFVSHIIDTLSNEEIEFIINKNKENKLLNKKEIAKLKSYLK